MKLTTIAIALAALLYLGSRKRLIAANTVQVGDLAEGKIMDGTNWTGDLWSRYTGATDLKDAENLNLLGSVQADPGKVGQAQLGLQPSWNGSL